MKEGNKDPVELQLALKVCREDLTKAQEELSRMKAEYWDVVPRRNWDSLEQMNQQTLLQVAHMDSHIVCTHTHISLFKIITVFTMVLYLFFCGIQLKTLQGDFDQLKSEYDTLLELYKRGSMQTETHDSNTVQVQYTRLLATFCFS